jgi:hypothetical protein
VRLALLRLHRIGPHADLVLRFVDDKGAVRPVTVLFGADGTGKTSILGAITSTRPGHALPPVPMQLQAQRADAGGPPFAMAEWALGDDDPSRPHTLRVASPSAQLEDEPGEVATLRRREQALFDKKAQEEGGFVLVAFSGARWFSRTQNLLSAPERNLVRYDVRASASFDDATRADLARETKQVLSYAAIAAALSRGTTEGARFGAFERSLAEVLSVLLRPYSLEWTGADAATLEPTFRTREGEPVGLDELPKGARHLAAIGSLTVRALFGAYPGSPVPPREREGVVLVDDLESQQDPAVLRVVVRLFEEALPRVQWVVGTAAHAVGAPCEPHEIVALRRIEHRIEVHEGLLAFVH